jgi:hypothetical protein
MATLLGPGADFSILPDNAASGGSIYLSGWAHDLLS